MLRDFYFWLSQLENDLFDDNWGVMYSSVQLLDDLLYKHRWVLGKITTAKRLQEEVKTEAIALEAVDTNAIEEVNLACENVKEVDGLGITKEGSDVWETAVERYDERIDRVETRITVRLRDQLCTAKNANEMLGSSPGSTPCLSGPTSGGPSGNTRPSLSRGSSMTSRSFTKSSRFSTCSPSLARCQ